MPGKGLGVGRSAACVKGKNPSEETGVRCRGRNRLLFQQGGGTFGVRRGRDLVLLETGEKEGLVGGSVAILKGRGTKNNQKKFALNSAHVVRRDRISGQRGKEKFRCRFNRLTGGKTK